jgi:CheY-like chemotaxis protein
LKVLVAEDNLINQKLILALLGKRGHAAVVTANGLEALSQWQTEKFDLIFMDVQMPEMDGLTATRQIRQAEEACGLHIPIVAMTARAMAGDRERCLEAGMDDYITKPLNRVSLDKVLTACMQTTSVAPASSTQEDSLHGVDVKDIEDVLNVMHPAARQENNAPHPTGSDWPDPAH